MKGLQQSQLWDNYLQSAVCLSRKGNLSGSQNLITYALADAEAFHEWDERIEWYIYSLADDLCAVGNYSAATSMYNQLVETKKNILGKLQPKVCLERLAIMQISKLRNDADAYAEPTNVITHCRDRSIWTGVNKSIGSLAKRLSA